jgi:hypothetical protein
MNLKKQRQALIAELGKQGFDDAVALIEELVDKVEELETENIELKEKNNDLCNVIAFGIRVHAITAPNGITEASTDYATPNATLVPDEGTEL